MPENHRQKKILPEIPMLLWGRASDLFTASQSV